MLISLCFISFHFIKYLQSSHAYKYTNNSRSDSNHTTDLFLQNLISLFRESNHVHDNLKLAKDFAVKE